MHLVGLGSDNFYDNASLSNGGRSEVAEEHCQQIIKIDSAIV